MKYKEKDRKLKEKNYSILILLIIIFGGAIRFYNSDENPPGIFTDEAVNGYEAYSISITGRDSHGNFLPKLFDYHGIDKGESLHTYLTAVIIYFLDINIRSSRFFAVLIGTLTILTTYLLTKTIFDKNTAIISSLFIAFSPWHFHLSRIAFRTIFIPFFITSTLYFLYKIQKNTKYILTAAITAGLSLHTYSTIRIILPVILITITIFHLKEIAYFLKKHKKKKKTNLQNIIILSIIIFSLIAGPIYYWSFSEAGKKRFNQISIFNTEEPVKTFASNFLKHISPNFLFLTGDNNLRHSIPGFGQMLIILSPFLILGLIIGARNKKILLFLLLASLGFITSSLTNEGIPHALRSFSAVPFLEIIAAYGAVKTYEKINKNIWKKYFVIIVSILFVLNASYYFHSYFVKYPTISQGWWEYGWEEAINYAEKNSDNYDKIIVHTKWPNEIFIKFFAKINPKELQKTGKLGKYDVCYDDKFSCFKKGKNLYIVKPNELRDKKILHQVYDNNKNTVLKIVE